MSVEAVQAVLERTVTDPSFRTRLFTEPDVALAEYELTSDENGALRELCVDASQSESAGLDRLNAFLFDGNLPHLYSPSGAARLFTGLGAGLGLGLIAIPVVASVVWKQPSEEASIEGPIELLAGLALIGLVGGLMLVGVGVLLWPIALAMLGAVLIAFGVANLYVIVLASGQARRAGELGDLRGGLIGSLGLGLLELAGLSLLRTFLIATFGFSWGV